MGKLLAIILSEPEREFAVSELCTLVSGSQPTVWRELDIAVGTGLVKVRKVGRSSLYQGNFQHPMYPHLLALASHSFGIPAVLGKIFSAVHGVEAVVLFGSWAARFLGVEGQPPNDIDVLILGKPSREEIFAAAARAEKAAGMEVNATVRSVSSWRNPDSFIQHVQSNPHLVLFVNPTNENLAGLTL
jgi:predicted nucleotidyltransferase